jgi:hypothetical protein
MPLSAQAQGRRRRNTAMTTTTARTRRGILRPPSYLSSAGSRSRRRPRPRVSQWFNLHVVCGSESSYITKTALTVFPLYTRYYHAAVVRSHQSKRLVVRCGLMASVDPQDLSLCSGPLLWMDSDARLVFNRRSIHKKNKQKIQVLCWQLGEPLMKENWD